MLHHRKNPQTVQKSYAYAAVAKAEGAQLLYFSPKHVNFEERKINGYIYEDGNWRKTESPFPDVIYNTGSPEKLEKSIDTINKLKQEIPFTTNSIGNKMRVQRRLEKYGEFTKYLIPSEIIHSTRAFFNFLRQYRKIIFKPVNGHKGQGIVFVETVRDQYHLLIGTESNVFSFEEMRDFVSDRIRQELYLVQPYINCKTKEGIAYDLRLHVQKNGAGKWAITAAYPRFACKGSIVSNINSGGSTNYLIPFLKQEFGEEYYDLKRYLEIFALQLAEHMDKIQQETFSETIDELGIDVGLDDTRKAWIYEVNWRPGCPPAFYLELNVVINTIRYAILLAKERKVFIN
jgi:UDP-N-acetylmuramoyl-tripeptide--D-alanyl-D-alanine ligase